MYSIPHLRTKRLSTNIENLILLLNHILHVDEVIEVEKYPGDVTEDEDNDDADEDEGKVDLTSHFVDGPLVGVSESGLNEVRISNYLFM